MSDNDSLAMTPGGPGTPPNSKAPSIEFVLSQQANDAIAKGANPKAVSDRLGQMVAHLRANPTLAFQASDALGKGADPGAVGNRVWQMAQQGGSGNVDLRGGSATTPVAPAVATPSTKGAVEGILDSGLDMLTVGLHRKGLGAIQAIGDAISRRANSHPVDAYHDILSRSATSPVNAQDYNQSVSNTIGREHAAANVHPLATKAANATGLFGALAAEAPVRAALGMGEAVPAATSVIRRIGQSAKTGAATGAAVGATSSEGNLNQRLGDSVLGALLGGTLGGGGQALGEMASGAGSVIRQLRTDPAKAGAEAADRHIAQRLAADDLNPGDLLGRAQVAERTGSPAVVAHLGGPSLDPLTWLAAQGPSREAGVLRNVVNAGQEAQGPLLNRGLRQAGNLGDQSAYKAAQKIDRQKSLSANRLFGIAEASPPINDPEITKAFIQEPELLKAMQQTVRALGENATPEELRAVQSIAKVAADPRFAGVIPPQPIPLRLLSETKKEVDALVKSLANKSPNFTDLDARRIQEAMRGILDRADAQSPEWATARGVFKNDSDRLAAIESGGGILSKQPERIADEVSGMADLDEKSPFTNRLATQNQPDYKLGGVDAIERAMAEKGPASNLAKLFFSSPADKRRVSSLLGPEAAAKLDPFVEQANTLNRVFESTSGNSATTPRQIVRQEVLGAGPGDALDLPTTPKHAVLRMLNKKDQARREAVLQVLAGRLNVPANSPQLPSLIADLERAAQPSPISRTPSFTDVLQAYGPRAGGILSGLFSGGQ